MKLYNTLTRSLEEFEPIDSDNVKFYTCGPTVYSTAHIGNFRTYITSDVLRRAINYLGYKTTFVMNITDVGHMRFSNDEQKVIDPIMEEAKKLSMTPLELAQKYTDIFLSDSKKLNILPPDVLPKASEHVKEMIEMTEILLEKGYAYVSGGDVYFNVKKFKDYGKLSGNTLDKMDQLLEAVRESVETDKNKKDSADFALWKAKGDRVLEWDSPWGKGVPGWHIECSAMSVKYLGLSFDIHGGGEDLIFPHHEDEIAQTEGTTGQQFVKYWVHSTYLHIEGEKMSKTKKNFYTLSDLEEKGFSPLTYRYLTFLTHYQTRMNLTWEGLDAAQTALNKLYEEVSSWGDEVGEYDPKLEKKFYDELSDNLNMPKAVGVLWELVRSKLPNPTKLATIYKFDEVLGLRIQDKTQALTNIPAEIQALVEQREAFRKQKLYTKADQMRNQIEKRGYIIKDDKKGTQILKKI